ncbi:MAG: prepilin peptidase [Acidobacteria bacterium]|nr:prepilin peptidase [Acidobacteriota bacterium]
MTLLLIYCAILGLAVGSFSNVIIYRVPRHLSIVRPRSACPNCHHAIAERDNIPVISWVLLHGRCRHCHSPISVRYPLVELSTGILFGLTAWRVGAHLDLVAYLILVAALVSLALIDLEQLLLPRSIVYPTLFAVAGWLLVCAVHYGQWHRLAVAAICAVSWFALFFALNFFSPRSLGFGDVRLSLVLGLALGWLGVGVVFIGFFASNLIGAVVGLSLIAAKKRTRDEPIPYGVYLAAGTIVAILLGPVLLAHWHSWPNAH